MPPRETILFCSSIVFQLIYRCCKIGNPMNQSSDANSLPDMRKVVTFRKRPSCQSQNHA